MNLNGEFVNSKAFGRGIIAECSDPYIRVDFSDAGVKQFVFPDAFEKFIAAEDAELQKQLENIVKEKQLLNEKKRLERLQLEAEKNHIVNEQIKTPKKKAKTCPKANIAFKCNFCDGGGDVKNIGFISACSDDMINYNIEEARHSWCCNNDSPCMQYYNGKIDRNELDNIDSSEGGFVCYESQMLKNWTAFAGNNLIGDNKGKPMKLNKIQINSLAVLTTRRPYSKEADRFIFGVFLVDEAYEGDNKEEGYVTTTSKYKLKLSPQEAAKIKYWNYYYNRNKPDVISWGQGLHRYLSDEQAAQILKDIVKVKTGKMDATLAKEFYTHFCRINGMDENMINEAGGALLKG